MRHLFAIYTVFAALVCLSTSMLQAEINYVRDVRPIFQKHCYSCHGAKVQKSGLRLDIKTQAFKGGELYGRSIINKNAQKSLLIQFISDPDAELQMPPEGKRLTQLEIGILTKWINQGADWPDGVDLAKLIDKKDHWSFKPITNPTPPTLLHAKWPRNAIDQFILSKLQKAGLNPSNEAGRINWLRRVTFDLTGLPPTIEEVKAFVRDDHKKAYEHVVDRLLKSPRYGERWAQHWLDVVRYADTHGFEVNTERPHAWPYRDYVIAAFNKDTPYDQFIREQIVGDAYTKDAATGFLVTASVLLPGQIGKDAPSIRLARQDALDEIVVNIGQTFLGLSIGCARCHDHKFDPITQRDYYSLQAFVAGVVYGDRQLRSPDDKQKQIKTKQVRARLSEIDDLLLKFVPLARPGLQKVESQHLRPAVNAKRNVDRFTPVYAKRVRFTIQATNSLEPCIDEMEILSVQGENVALAKKGAKYRSSGNTTVINRHELKFINDGKYGNSRSWMSNQVGKGWVEIEFPETKKIQSLTWGRDREGKFNDRLPTQYYIEVSIDKDNWQRIADSSDRKSYITEKPSYFFTTDGLKPKQLEEAKLLLNEKGNLEKVLAELTNRRVVFAGKFRKPDDIHILRRGDPEQPRERVSPAIPELFGADKPKKLSTEQQRRKALADWLASKDNPLTARVMVNRIWIGHFGKGLVDTPNDFGRNGSTPSHPQLLNYLATRFIRSDWSIKQLHKLIVLSATYRQSAASHKVGMVKDADIRLLWRYPTRRLDAESIRDSILAVSGTLNLEMGGSGFNLFDKRGGLTGFQPIESFKKNGLRRMIYAHKVRRERDAVFGAFDCPDGGQSLPSRRDSTTPIQALNLLNSRFIIEQATAFASRVKSARGNNVEMQINQVYQEAFSRPPTPAEIKNTKPFVHKYGLETLCRAVFNSNEYLFIP